MGPGEYHGPLRRCLGGLSSVKIHIVKQGDTLFELSKKYNVPLQAIIDANPQLSDPNKLNIGDKIKIPTTSSPGQGTDNVLYKHVVKQGDTLYKLSKAWGVPLQALIDANPQLSDPNVLKIGEVINIPKVSTTPAPTPAPTPPPPPAPLPANPPVSPSHTGKKNTAPKPIENLPPKAEEKKPVQPMTPPPAPQFIQQIQIIEENTYTKVEKAKCEPEHPPKKPDCGCEEKPKAVHPYQQCQTPVKEVSSYYDLPPISPYTVDQGHGQYPGISNIPTYPIQNAPNAHFPNCGPEHENQQWGMSPAQHCNNMQGPANMWGNEHLSPYHTHPSHCHPFAYVMPIQPCVFTPANMGGPTMGMTPWGPVLRDEEVHAQEVTSQPEVDKEVSISNQDTKTRIGTKRKSTSVNNTVQKKKTASKSKGRQNPWSN